MLAIMTLLVSGLEALDPNDVVEYSQVYRSDMLYFAICGHLRCNDAVGLILV